MSLKIVSRLPAAAALVIAALIAHGGAVAQNLTMKIGTATINDTQRARFIEAAREAECNEDEAVFDRSIKHVAKAPPKPKKKSSEKANG